MLLALYRSKTLVDGFFRAMKKETFWRWYMLALSAKMSHEGFSRTDYINASQARFCFVMMTQLKLIFIIVLLFDLSQDTLMQKGSMKSMLLSPFVLSSTPHSIHQNVSRCELSVGKRISVQEKCCSICRSPLRQRTFSWSVRILIRTLTSARELNYVRHKHFWMKYALYIEMTF